jgi:hypothetical protein
VSGLHACTVSCPAACQSPPPGTAIVDSLDCGLCAWKKCLPSPGASNKFMRESLAGAVPRCQQNRFMHQSFAGAVPRGHKNKFMHESVVGQTREKQKTRYIITYNIFLNNLYPVFWPKQDIIYIILYQTTPRQCSSSLPRQHACVSLTVEMEAHRRSLQPESRCS